MNAAPAASTENPSTRMEILKTAASIIASPCAADERILSTESARIAHMASFSKYSAGMPAPETELQPFMNQAHTLLPGHPVHSAHLPAFIVIISFTGHEKTNKCHILVNGIKAVSQVSSCHLEQYREDLHDFAV